MNAKDIVVGKVVYLTSKLSSRNTIKGLFEVVKVTKKYAYLRVLGTSDVDIKFCEKLSLDSLVVETISGYVDVFESEQAFVEWQLANSEWQKIKHNHQLNVLPSSITLEQVKLIKEIFGDYV